MLRSLAVALFAVSAAVGSGAARAQALPAPPARTINVTGEAEVRVVPDEAVLRLGVETVGEDLDATTAATAEAIAAISAVARGLGVPETGIQTDRLSLEPLYASRRVGDGQLYVQELYGYRAGRGLVLTLRDLSVFDALLERAVAAGANRVEGVEFRTTELRRHRDEARAEAIDAAREKAEALAGRLGQRLGAPRSIQESAGGWPPYGRGATQNVMIDAGGGDVSMGATSPGQISVRARVSVVFTLVGE